MKEAQLNGRLVLAGPDSPEMAFCPSCRGVVKRRKRRRQDGLMTYFYRHEPDVGDGCPRRYRPVT
jgi:hypothetical protein